MFETILIANRGEIACRIIKTARSMGIKTVAIYSSEDKDSLHVRLADSAYWVGEAPAKDSYLNIDAILSAAQEAKAQAIHPGYGFLSENPKFAKACAQANIVFIGPSVEAIEAMASKQVSKQLLEKTPVPLTPGYHGKEQSEKHLLKEAQKIGYPILIKAANGGGGKGMRTVYKESEFSEALAGAIRESKASFADDTVILEKLIQHPRHVEVQIMADTHGNVVHVFQRDCSIQRRHQKIIEEAPAPDLSPALQKKLEEAACQVARSIQYTGAGTVEFLVDGAEHFYFMEMNTRLQVEHPVTELITGLDLVAWQLHIAAGQSLPLTQEGIQVQGHAIECRIYAEDPEKEFIPSKGTIDFLKQPMGEGIRIDTGVVEQSRSSLYYDPMIAKLIAWGSDREEALQRLNQALAQYYIGGIKTNIPFLQAICQHPKFIKAQLSTDFLENESLTLPKPDERLILLMTVAFDYLNTLKSYEDPLLQDTFAWQTQGPRQWTYSYLIQDLVVKALVTPIDTHQLTIRIEETDYPLRASLMGDSLHLEWNKKHYKALVHNTERKIILYTDQGQMAIERFSWDRLHISASAHKAQLTAPMPATVVAVLKNIGDTIKAGDRLIVLEAMKMEHTIHAPNDGILLEIFYSVGAQVNEGAELVSLSESEA
ncbi:MAG: acetyl/propionyl/methylcrotonyl-CoA carboxylase subunit alpha [Legionellales bacterium]